jgi:nitric oxide reductase subunit B
MVTSFHEGVFALTQLRQTCASSGLPWKILTVRPIWGTDGAGAPVSFFRGSMMSFRKLWIAFRLVVVLSFTVLGWTGFRIYQSAPPVPDRVVTSDGRQVLGPGDIYDGQNVWQSIGGMEVGSIWGHGSYVAPDWTADWLHREAVFILDRWSGGSRMYDTLPPPRQAELQSRCSNSFGRIPMSTASSPLTRSAQTL